MFYLPFSSCKSEMISWLLVVYQKCPAVTGAASDTGPVQPLYSRVHDPYINLSFFMHQKLSLKEIFSARKEP